MPLYKDSIFFSVSFQKPPTISDPRGCCRVKYSPFTMPLYPLYVLWSSFMGDTQTLQYFPGPNAECVFCGSGCCIILMTKVRQAPPLPLMNSA